MTLTAPDEVDEPDDLRDMVRHLLEKESPVPRSRAVAEAGDGFDHELWRCLAEAGWTGLWVDELFGGAGHHGRELVIVLEELGRHLVGGPFLSTALLGAAALGAAGDALRRDHLPALALGERRVALALTAAFGGHKAEPLRAVVGAGGARLDGTTRFVPDAHVADLLILHAIGDDGTERLYVVDRDQRGVDVAVEPTVDATRRLCRVRLDGVAVPDAALVVPPERTPALVEELVRLAAVGIAADCAGGARRALELTVAYAKDRSQFGRAIGSFQAIKHRCADMYLQVEGASTVLACAAAALDDAAATSIAKSYAADAYVSVVHDAILTHGAIGAMWEHDLHLHLKRAKLDQVLFGSSAWHRRRIVDATFAARRGA